MPLHDNEQRKRQRDEHESDSAESMECDDHQRPTKKVMLPGSCLHMVHGFLDF